MNSLKKNISALYIIQIANFVLPLLTLPWLTRILGPEGYGKINFALATTSILVLITDYGFNLTATKEIAIHRDNRNKRTEIFWHVITIKLIFAALSGFGLLVATIFIEKLATEKTLLSIAFMTVFSSILTPTWYYQGMERIGFISLLNFFIRLCIIPFIFLLVRNSNDINIAMCLNVTGGLLTGIIAQLHIYRRTEIGAFRVKFKQLIKVVIDGWHIFISYAGVNMYTTTNTLIIGFLLGNKAVGVYSAAEKIINAASGLVAPISQAIFPRISYLANESRESAEKLILKTLKSVMLLTGTVSLLIFIFCPTIVVNFYGPNFQDTTAILMVLSIVPFIKGISNVLGMQTMIPFGLKKEYSLVLIFSGGISIPLLTLLVTIFGLIGAASSVVIIEFLILFWMKLILNRKIPPTINPNNIRNMQIDASR